MRIGEHETRQRDLLRLRGSEREPTGADLGVQPFVEATRPVGRVDRAQRRPQLGVPRSGPRKEEVVAQGADKDVMLLVDQGHVGAHLLGGHRRQSGAAQCDLAGTGSVDAASSRPSVDFPAPDGPTRATREPGSTARDTSRRTSTPAR